MRCALFALLFVVGCGNGAVAPSTSGPDSGPSTPLPDAPAPPDLAPAPIVAGKAAAVPLPDGTSGIGFDDLRFSGTLGRVLAPAGGTGKLDLIDPKTAAISSVDGFSSSGGFAGGHGDGTTSVDEGRGLLFATDRTTRLLDVVDPQKMAIVASAALGGAPDYVRFVAATNEVWVTSPNSERIEVFTVPTGAAPTPAHAAYITVRGGPESLVIDNTRNRAYTHLWSSSTVAIDLSSRTIVETWQNGCVGSRGIALDEKSGFLFAGCDEGAGVVLDVANGGKQLSKLASATGVDVIDFNPVLRHLYLPGQDDGEMTIASVSATGQLARLGSVTTAIGAHCVAADNLNNAWVCDPDGGGLLKWADPYPAP